MNFPILTHSQLIENIKKFDAIQYCKTRNFLTGNVSQWSPYITHGIITINEIVDISLEKYSIDEAEMRYKELLWREYFTQVHYRKGNAIFQNMEDDKTWLERIDILPIEVQTKTFWSGWVNQCIAQLEQTGYLHNHQRMRLASYMTHRQKLNRKKCADRSYYHFLDGELGSNHLSRQRVQSTFSHKPYFMNEENLQRYGKYRDWIFAMSYEELEKKIYNNQRKSDIEHSNDIYQTIQSDTSDIPQSQRSYNNYNILTPRDLHPSKIHDNSHTVCVLDKYFTQLHPRSRKRIEFVEKYCTLYSIKFVLWDISEIIKNSSNIQIFKTRNPIYREAYEKASHRTDIQHHRHNRCTAAVSTWYTKKFFPFREHSKKSLYDKQRLIHKLT